jgi:hypothetical protein
MSRLDDLRPQYHRVLHSIEFAHAMDNAQTYGREPRPERVLESADELRREIAALSAEERR